MIEIRAAKADDSDLIVDFQLKMAYETEKIQLDWDTLKQGVKAVFGQSNKGCYFIAEMDGEACASLMITYEWSDWRNRNIWWIQSVYVKPEARRKGVYAAMYAHIKTLVTADPSVGGIRLYVDKTNTPAQQTYSKMGMNGDHYQVFEWMKDF
jgi:ribosomal protein S18 acetylase RimI-like enzyme